MIGRSHSTLLSLRQISKICHTYSLHRSSTFIIDSKLHLLGKAVPRARQRCGPSPRLFSSTSQNHDSGFKNHYEILRMPPTATKAELKKQFYVLSKETHPDRHPDDPTAAERFSQISESYSILGNDEKRRLFDRDLQRMQGGGRGGGGPGGANAGTYAGSRPASGLSKRRGTFRGPPPSFYAQGGYGSTANGSSQNQGAGNQGGGGGGGGDPYMAGTFNAQSFADRQNTDYNPETTYRTQTVEDQRRLQRRAAEFRARQSELDALSDSDFWGRFVIVTFIVALGVTVGGLVVNMTNTPRGGYTRGDGSKRGDKKNEWARG